MVYKYDHDSQLAAEKANPDPSLYRVRRQPCETPTACGFCEEGWVDRSGFADYPCKRRCPHCLGTGQALTPAEADAEVERLRAAKGEK